MEEIKKIMMKIKKKKYIYYKVNLQKDKIKERDLEIQKKDNTNIK
jgi:hypothetical protein